MQQRKNSIHHQHVAVAAEDAAVVVADAMETAVETAEATVPAAAETKNWESKRCLELHFVLYH